MNASVSSVLGAMGPLIWKLKVLLQEASEDDPNRWPLPKAVKDGIDLLKEDLEEINTYLEDLSELEDPPLTAKSWMKEVRELLYDIEDYIDSDFARPSCIRTRTNVKTRPVCKIKINHVQLNGFPKRKKLTRHEEVRIKISEFRIRVQEANERHKRYELDCLDVRRRYAPSGPMLPWRRDEAADLVIDGHEMSDFTHILACDEDHHQLKVVSIVGPGGLGKTTFARALYTKIRGQFDCRAFVPLTRKPNIKNVLGDILTQVQRQQAHADCEDLDITSRIRKHLHSKRYLIVIDNLWDASAWNIISRAFPEGSQRSRIIITSQVEDVALTCCRYQPEFVFEMKPLDIYHSRKLFFDRVFGSKSDCPEIFKEVSYKIVDMCGGSPLATVNVASLLASHSVTLMEQCAYISDSLGTMLRRSSTSEGIRQVLNLSYDNLTHYLKSCLLYLNMYPEGCIICKDDLVNQWVAEGFINDTIEGPDMQSVARSYFDEFIDRGFIQPACIKYNDEIVSCTVNATVYDLIAYNSAEENFVTLVDADRKNVELSNKVRRLSLNFGDAMYAKKPRYIRPSHVRSLAFSGFFACMPSITEFKLLRVLNLQLSGHRGDEILNLNGISELFQLRYFKVVSDICIELPKHMRGLHHLETLDLDAKVTAFPWDIIHLPCLLHLRLPFEQDLMDWINSMGSNIVRRLGKLTNLRDLRLICCTAPPSHLQKIMEALGSLLGGLRNLEILALVPGSSYEKTVVHGPSEAVVSWDGFEPPFYLKRFEWSLCSCIFSRVPKWMAEFGNLCILKIVVKELLRDGVDILKGLPALTALSLYVHAAPVERIVFDKAGFSAIKFFKFRCSVPWLKFEADAMPNLLKLKLGFNANRVGQHCDIPIVIEHLPCLKQIYAKIGGAGAGADAESTLTAAVLNHQSNPTINIQLVDSMFFRYETRSKATEDKGQDKILKVTAQEVSCEEAKKQADFRFSAPSVFLSLLPHSDIHQILKEAQHRWLRPAEICEILKNYRNFRIAPEPPNRPPSGSLFLFDRKILRYFRKDGHNWRKNKDRKTVKEAHEKLKSGSIDVLHCYYAHGEDNINFQRRTYWMLEEGFMHIVLVHYLETKLSDDATGGMPAMENNFPQNDGSLEAAVGYPFLSTQSSSLSNIQKGSFFKKSDSFTRWMSKELGEVEDSQIQSSSGIFWSTEDADSIIEASSREPLDQFTMAPIVSQDNLFSIVDFAPTWTYTGSKTKILISGKILNNSQVIERCKWSCMFGEVEVPAQMLADGTLLCYAPPHKPGRVPFYITCSNRLACSEVREFEFRPNVPQYMDAPSPHGATNKVYFQIRLDKLVSLGPDEYQATISNPSVDMIDLSKKISSLMMNNDEWSELLKLADDNELSTDDQKDQLAENLIKEKLHVWLLNKVGVGGKGPSVLDDEGQGVLHLAAALGYDWAIRPTISAGVNINFRDVHGWTALHWAAFCGRERTVVALIALGAAPGALTDPAPDFPSGSTPADLASANGHRGISGFLAESSLTSHLQALNLKEGNMGEISGLPGIGDITERTSLQPATGDSLGPVRNAVQAAARIYQDFRVQSFQRKQAAQYEDGKGGISDEPSKPGQDPLHAAASCIQNKFRGWKGRKEFLLIRQRIVKIQAHVRGHQVRKHYRKIVWSVGIVETVRRWRRRGAGLRVATDRSSAGTSSSLNEPVGDDYDFLQEGRKQTEERLQKALARIKSAQYPV